MLSTKNTLLHFKTNFSAQFTQKVHSTQNFHRHATCQWHISLGITIIVKKEWNAINSVTYSEHSCIIVFTTRLVNSCLACRLRWPSRSWIANTSRPSGCFSKISLRFFRHQSTQLQHITLANRVSRYFRRT